MIFFVLSQRSQKVCFYIDYIESHLSEPDEYNFWETKYILLGGGQLKKNYC